MNPIIKKKWLNALRSGKFEQTQGQLKKGNGYCCLGVLCEITGNAKNRNMSVGYPHDEHGLDDPSKPFCGLSTQQQSDLALLNDNGKTFNEIADFIERSI